MDKETLQYIKELNKKIHELEEQNADLRVRIAELEAEPKWDIPRPVSPWYSIPTKWEPPYEITCIN